MAILVLVPLQGLFMKKLIAVVVFFLFLPGVAFAQDAKSDFYLDIETDPVAFALSGHSLHVGVGWERYRFDFGNFGLEIPEFVHGNEGFTSRFDGFGAKFDVFYSKEQYGLFGGISGSFVRSQVGLRGSNQRIIGTQGTIDARIGYRVKLVGGFFISPWVSVGRMIGGGDIQIENRTYKQNDFTIFPTLHIGYQVH